MVCAALAGGYEEATRGSAEPLRDSAGRELGFHLPVSWELAGMLLRRADLSSMVDAIGGGYGGAALARKNAIAMRCANTKSRTLSGRPGISASLASPSSSLCSRITHACSHTASG